MEIYFIHFLVLGLSLVDTLNFDVQETVGNIAVGIVSAQQPWILLFASLIQCAVIMRLNSSIIAFNINNENQTCFFYSNFTTFSYDPTRTTYLKGAVNSFQLNPGTNVIYNSTDGYLYMFRGQTVTNWYQGLNSCNSVQGFSILLAKKIYQHKLLGATGFDSVIGLRRDNVTGKIYWNDGTPYEATEVSTFITATVNTLPGSDVFYFDFLTFDDYYSWMNPPFGIAYPACIANPFNFTHDY